MVVVVALKDDGGTIGDGQACPVASEVLAVVDLW